MVLKGSKISTKILLKDLYIIITLLVFMSSAINDVTTLLGAGGMILISLAINVKYMKCKSTLIPEMAVLLLLFQNFCIGLGAHLTGNFSEHLSLLTQVPTVFISISYAFVLTKKKIDKYDIVFFIYILLCLSQLFRINVSMLTKLPYLRNFVIFYMGFTVGKYYINTKDRIEDFTKIFLKLAVIAGLFGLLGVIIGRPFYSSIGTLEVYAAKRYTSYIDGLPGNFITIFAGHLVNRLASLYYDPVNFSYFMALAVLISFINRRKKHSIFFAICSFLTFGKGGLLIIILAVMCLLITIVLKKMPLSLVKYIVIVALLSSVIGLVYIIQTYFTDDFGTANHFYGIITGLNGIMDNPLGYGIGSAGNLLKSADNLLAGMEVSETGLINMTYQIGVISSALFLYLLFGTAAESLKNFRASGDERYLMFSYIPVILTVISIFQENTLTPQCIIPYMIFQGAYSNTVVINTNGYK